MALPFYRCCDLAHFNPAPVACPEDFLAAQEWLKKVVNSAQHSSGDLFTYFRLDRKNDQTVKIMSIKEEVLGCLFPASRRLSVAPMLDDGDPTAGAEPGGISSQDAALQATYLYYSVLHYILKKLFPKRVEAASSRFGSKLTVAPEDVPRAFNLLMIPIFHSSLLVVAVMLVKAIWSRDPTPLGSTPEEFQGIPHKAGFKWFEELFATEVSSENGEDWQDSAAGSTASAAPQLPSMPGRYVLGRLMRLCEEREVMAEGSTFYPIYEQLGGLLEGVYGGYTEGDLKLVLTFVQAYTRRAVALAGLVAQELVEGVKRQEAAQRRLTVHCAAGGINGKPPQKPLVPHDVFPKMTADLVDTIITTNLQLAFNQHMLVLLACCLYSAAKASGYQLSFKDIIEVIVDRLPDVSADVFETQVELQPAVPGPGSPVSMSPCCNISVPAVMGGIRKFYNSIFLLCAEGHVREFVTHARALSAAAKSTTTFTPHQHSAPEAFGGASIADFTFQDVTAGMSECPAASLNGWVKATPPGMMSEGTRAPAAKAAVNTIGGVGGERRYNAPRQDRAKQKLQVYEDDCVGDLISRGLTIRDGGASQQYASKGDECKSAASRRLSAPVVLQDRKPVVNGVRDAVAAAAAAAAEQLAKDPLGKPGRARKSMPHGLHALVTATDRVCMESKENLVGCETAAADWLGSSTDAHCNTGGFTKRIGGSLSRVR
ncbi:hypothetical protein VOLCADRAFT_87054 [Volvox carteri f. nagariensis]|uniref:Uncharacterized protein n=1 Tax=Volvox carteri f. nagariensis TaxID=3068 RepID=D8TK20_VOLCA|nr:uncharacterized protein VOLCADRAFT_87054 [Volvox carteri f. nagariensis]EFJ51986.1 hypothetical protein VOLCADRAFT_87054 [Volvox carteri f. nagariensis]|eukprot:XP_002946760.1 hypothetical protein VOLCADRAFT_87054 [Volvox carteri f. nagariensis]